VRGGGGGGWRGAGGEWGGGQSVERNSTLGSGKFKVRNKLAQRLDVKKTKHTARKTGSLSCPVAVIKERNENISGRLNKGKERGRERG